MYGQVDYQDYYFEDPLDSTSLIFIDTAKPYSDCFYFCPILAPLHGFN